MGNSEVPGEGTGRPAEPPSPATTAVPATSSDSVAAKIKACQASVARISASAERLSRMQAPPAPPLPAGSRLSGEITTPARSFRSPVVLDATERSGDAFRGVIYYGRGVTAGRRGVSGSVTPDGRGLTFSAEWFEGNVSPEAIRYDLSSEGGRLTGSWSTRSLAGTIHLTAAQRLTQHIAAH